MQSSSRPRVRRATRAAALVGAGLALAGGAQMASAGTTIVNPQFDASWTAGTEWSVAGTYTPQIVTDNTQTPPSAMRLTDASGNKKGSITYTIPQPAVGGLDVRFVLSEWAGSGSPPGNGLSFFLRKGSDPSNAAAAAGGGAGLGYVSLPGGLVGVGFDRFGGFPWTSASGTDCSPAGSGSFVPNSIAVRGPGEPAGWVDSPFSRGLGYCLLPASPNPWETSGISFGGTSRDSGARAVRVTVDPQSAPNPQIKVYYASTAGGTPTEVLSRDVPAAFLAEPTFKFGFAAATGGATIINEVWSVQVASLVDLPPVEITTASLPGGSVGTAYSCTAVAQANGVAPIAYAVASGSLPPGLTLNAATGEVCGTPTTAGTYSFTVSATDSRGPSVSVGTRAYTVAITGPGPGAAPTVTATVLVPRRNLLTGQGTKLAIRASNTGTTTASGVASCVTVPANLIVTRTNGGKRSTGRVCFTVGDVAAGASVTRSVTVRGVALRRVTRQVRGNVNAAGIASAVTADPVSVTIRPRAVRKVVVAG